MLLTRRRDSDDWVFPGGSVEEGEAPWEAAAREVQEETGLHVDVERLVGVYFKRREQDVVFVFSADRTGGELRRSDERDALGYFPPNALPDAVSERDRERVEDAIAARAQTALRVQPSDGDEPNPGAR